MSRAAARVRRPGQNNRIWATLGTLQKQSGLSKEDVRAVLDRVCLEVSGQTHSSKLTPYQAEQVIGLLSRELGQKAALAPTSSTPGDAEEQMSRNVISPKQQSFLAGLYRLLGWDRGAQMAFCRRQTRKAWPQDNDDMDKLVHALQDMVLRHTNPDVLLARVRALMDHPGLDDWQRDIFLPDLVSQYTCTDDPQSVMSTGKLAKLIEAEDRCAAFDEAEAGAVAS